MINLTLRVLLAGLDRLLRRLGYRRVVRLLLLTSLPPWRSASDRKARRLAWRIKDVTERSDGRYKCLHSTLLLWWILRWTGRRAEMVTAMGRPEEGLRFHTWLECDGIVLNDRQDIAQSYPVAWPVLDPSAATWSKDRSP